MITYVATVRQRVGVLPAGVALVAQRRGNSLAPLAPWVAYLCDRTRERIETAFSQIAERLARSIHAVTPRGLELLVFLTVLAYAITARLGLLDSLSSEDQFNGHGCCQLLQKERNGYGKA